VRSAESSVNGTGSRDPASSRQHRGCAIDVHAAQHDEAPRHAGERADEVTRVCSRTRDHVDHDLRRELLQLGDVAREPVPISPDLPHAGRRLGTGPSMEEGDIVAGPLQQRDYEASDEPGATDDEDAHGLRSYRQPPEGKDLRNPKDRRNGHSRPI
jgi:hypothetical protein